MVDTGALSMPLYSPLWFSPQVLRSFHYEQGAILWLIPAVPFLFTLRSLLFFRFRKTIDVAFLDRAGLRSFSAILRFVPPGLLSFSLMLGLLALARPQRTDVVREQHSEGIDIILALDISRSMEAQDLYPNRLEAVKKVARKFIRGRNHDRIGLVVFAGEAYSLSPLTSDYELLSEYADAIDFSMVPTDGTAMGTALGVATNRMRESTAKSKVIVLLSDGANTSGNIDPLTAADLAAAFGIKIYTIAAGRDAEPNANFDPNAPPPTFAADEGTLQQIAKKGDGMFFRAENNEALSSVFGAIDRYEKAEIKETRFRETHDYYGIYLTWGMAMFLLWMLSKNTFMANALED
ncbi:MAG: VWA domain-containing protein [Bacteroidota bacterium]